MQSHAGVRNLPQHIHIVGIGGIGFSAIARVLAQWGYTVTGSDLHASSLTQELNALGIKTYVGHAPEQVRGADLVAISSAVPANNPEVQAAQAAGIPVIKRHTLLGEMMSGRYGIAIAGTHGKTTTSAMMTVILQRLGYAPTFIVGGIIVELGTNAATGAGPHFVIEADEYDRTFHGLQPQIAVVTNVEMDHPDCYRDIAEMREAFSTFLDRVPQDGYIVACADSPDLMRVLRGPDGTLPRLVTYGLAAEAHYRVQDILPNARGGVDYGVYYEDALWGTFSLAIPGCHNALNATAALIVAHLVGADRRAAGQVLADFRGVLRRFEIKGEGRGVLVVDDYAHHPTEIRATLAAARARYPQRCIWAVWQPHTFSRVEALLDEFSACFADADHVIVTDIYAARAREKATISADSLATRIQHQDVRHIGALDEVVSYLVAELRAGDVLLTLGAGDGYLIGERVLEQLAR
jgi:UDP-N-acetylmuramate--alanine ligase